MFDHCLYFNTTALARRLEREWTDAFSVFALSPAQAFMLRVILAKPGLLQRELAAELSIARPTATRALDHLQAKGFIERHAGDSDARETSISPTKKAVALKAPLNAASASVTSRLKEVLGSDAFADTVTKIHGVRAALD